MDYEFWSPDVTVIIPTEMKENSKYRSDDPRHWNIKVKSNEIGLKRLIWT